MKKNIVILGLFSCLAVMQIVAPLSMIVKREMTLRNGTQFRFRTEPVDPYDAFRGRYVALGIEQDKAPKPDGVELRHGQKVYAYLGKDEEGFATISKITIERPHGGDYLAAEVRYPYGDTVTLKMPFDRYYMEEKAAPLAEAAYRKHHREEKPDAYVTVRIKSGFAVLEELYIGGEPVSEVIKKR